MIKLIACLDKFGGIGRKNTIPWKCSVDMKWFKEVTTNNMVVMGRRTFESLNKKGLPNRANFVVTTAVTQPMLHGSATFLPTLSDFLFQPTVQNGTFGDTYIIGGASVYKKALELLAPQELLIGRLDIDGECDTFFPAIPSIYQPVKIEEINSTYKRITYAR